jgi:hypothetical protein
MSGSSSAAAAPTSGASQAQWSAEMQAIQQQSMQESLVEAQTNEVVNRNNGMAQSAAGVGRSG